MLQTGVVLNHCIDTFFLYSTLAEPNFKRITTKTLTQHYIEMLLLNDARHDNVLFLPFYTIHSLNFTKAFFPSYLPVHAFLPEPIIV